MQWHSNSAAFPNFSAIPAYCRPVDDGDGKQRNSSSYYGDGSCASLEKNVVRQGKYAARFTMKNSANGSEPADCDNGVCTRRRSGVITASQLKVYKPMPQMSERWLSYSVYLPTNWSDNGTGWGPTLFGIKPLNNYSGVSAALSLGLSGGQWGIQHRWSDVKNVNGQVPWQQQMHYTGDEPSTTSWPDGLKYFATPQSQAALASVLKGGWTDWVFHAKFDARGKANGGTGFVDVFKREGSGSWIHVLKIRPGVTTRGGKTFDHGIGYDNDGYAIGSVGMYAEKGQVWPLSQNRELIHDNVKIGCESATLENMAPEGWSGLSTKQEQVLGQASN